MATIQAKQTSADDNCSVAQLVEGEPGLLGPGDHFLAGSAQVFALQTAPVGAFIDEDLLLDCEMRGIIENPRRKAAAAGWLEGPPDVGPAARTEGPLPNLLDAYLVIASTPPRVKLSPSSAAYDAPPQRRKMAHGQI